jgi:signal transduction histidine kinase
MTLRAKLTLIYGGLFVVAGVVLTGLTFVLVQWRLNHPRADLPSWCVAARSGRLKLTAAQSALCTHFERAETLHEIVVASLLGLGVTALAAFGVGYFVAGQVLRPLSRMTETARRIAQRPDTAKRTRIALAGPADELRELADTFDDMLDRLDLAFETQRRFTGNASHELRTPLAINRTLLEVTLMDPEASDQTRQLCRTLLATNERSERMIEGLLLLAMAGVHGRDDFDRFA